MALDLACGVFVALVLQGAPVPGTHHRLPRQQADGDVCPAYTARVIRYDLRADENCRAKGGVKEEVYVPSGIAVVKREYCVPPILAAKPARGTHK